MVKRQKQTKAAQKQKQTVGLSSKAAQTQIVNVNIGSKRPRKRAKKGAAKEAKKGRPEVFGTSSRVQIIPAFNPPPIINYPPGFGSQQPNAWATPPPPTPQRQYAAFAEGETAGPLGVDQTVPVPFTFVGAERVLKPAPKTPALTSLVGPPIFGAPEPSLAKSLFAEEEDSLAAAADSAAFEAGRAAEELKAARKATRRERAAEKREAGRAAGRTSPVGSAHAKYTLDPFATPTGSSTAEPKSEITFLGVAPEEKTEKGKGLERERKATPSVSSGAGLCP